MGLYDDDAGFQQYLKDNGIKLEPETPQPTNSGIVGDTITGLKRGIEKIPGVVTGLADIPAGVVGFNRPFTKAADWVGEKTGFQPGKWADEAQSEYSPQLRDQMRNVADTKGFWNSVGAYIENPRAIANQVAESLPSTIATGGIGRGLMAGVMGAEKLAASRAGLASADEAVQLASRKALLKGGATAGGIGEGMFAAGQHMSEMGQDVDPLRAAATATLAGIGTGLIGKYSGDVARKLGVDDIESGIAAGVMRNAGTKGAAGYAKSIVKGALTEGTLEEMPQSMQEQIWQNVANGKDWHEGVAEAGAAGLVTGAAMGAGVNATPNLPSKPQSRPLSEENQPTNLLGYNSEVGTSWNNTYNYNPIIAEGSESQVPLERLDMLQGRRDVTEARDMMHSDFSDRAADERYGMPTFDVNDQTLPDPTDPGSAVAVLQVLSHAAQNGQAIIEGSRAHEVLLGAQKLLTENGLSYIAQRAPEVVPKAGKASAAETITTPTSPKSQMSRNLDMSIAEHIAAGTLAGDHPIVQEWNASKKQAKDANVIGKKLIGVLSSSSQPAQAAATQTATNPVPAATREVAPVKLQVKDLTAKQQPVYQYMLDAIENGKLDDVVDAQGVFKFVEIGDKLGIARGSAKSFITQIAKRIAKKNGISVETMKAMLKARVAAIRTTETHDEDRLGLSPALQVQIANEQDYLGGEGGSEQSMGLINSIGGSQGETESLRHGHGNLNEDELHILRTADKTKNEVKQDAVQTENERAIYERNEARAKAKADEEDAAVLAHPEAKNAELDWNDFKSDEAPAFSDMTKRTQAAWVVQYVETVSNDSSNAAIESAAKDFERQLEASDVRTETQRKEGGTPTQLERAGEVSQGALPAPVPETIVTTKKRRVIRREEVDAEGRSDNEKTDRNTGVSEPVERSYQSESVGREAEQKSGTVRSAQESNNTARETGTRENGSPDTAGEEVELTEEVIAQAWDDGIAGTPLPVFSRLDDESRQWLLGAVDAVTLQARFNDVVDGLMGDSNSSSVAPGRYSGAGAVAPVNIERAAHQKAVQVGLGAVNQYLSTNGHQMSAGALTGDQLSVIGGALQDIETVLGVQWLARVRGFGTLITKAPHDAVAVKSSGTLLVSPELLDEAVAGDSDALSVLRETLVHEVTHLWDRQQNSTDTVVGYNPKFAPTGAIYSELVALYTSGNAPFLTYPLGAQFQNWPDSFIAQELLAQAAVLYAYQPNVLKYSAPQTYQLIKEMVDATARHPNDKRGIGPSHIGVLNAIRPSARRQGAEHQVRSSTPSGDTPASQRRAGNERASSEVGGNAQGSTGDGKVELGGSRLAGQQTPTMRKTSGLVRQLLEVASDKSKSVQYALMFGHQFSELAEKIIPGAKQYFSSLNEKQRERVRQEEAIAKIATSHYALKQSEQNAVNRMIDRATSQEAWPFKPEWFPEARVDSQLGSEFNQMTPAQQQIVKDVFKFGSEQQKRFDESINDLMPEGKKIHRKQMMGVPYAPLKRFGDHVVIGKSAAYMAEEASLDKQGLPTSEKLDEMKADPNHYHVEFVDGDFEAVTRRDALAEANPTMAWGKKPLQVEHRDLNAMSFTMLERLKNSISDVDKTQGATKAALESLANQLYIAQLNHLHANKSQQTRKGVKGYDQDMMRAFVSQGRSEAALIASLKTHTSTEAALQRVTNAARHGSQQDKKTRIANEILRRHVAILNYKETPIQNKLMATNSLYFLLTSPAYYLTNATQPFVLSLPVMTAAHGSKAWGAMTGAYKQAFDAIKLFKNTNLDENALKTFDSVGDESGAIKALLDENLVNIGMEMELGDIVDSGGGKVTKAFKGGMKFMRTTVANVETLNRLSTAVAAYRLAYTEALNQGKTKDEAHTAGTMYARDVIIKTHGDYAGYNAPSIMMQGAYGTLPVKVLMQFKKFQFIQAGLLIGAFRQVVNGATPEEKAVARKTLAYVLGTQMALAGSLGIPLAGTAAAALAATGADDGEDKEAYLRRLIGNKTIAQLLLHGAPAAAGVDISKRVGMGNVFTPLPFVDNSGTANDRAKNLILGVAGPSASLFLRSAQGVDQMQKGQYWKGFESLLPNGLLTNLSKVARFESEGVTNGRGDVVMRPEEVGFFDDISQTLGLPSTTLTDRSWKAGVAYDRKKYFRGEADGLKRDYTEARKSGGSTAEITQKWHKLQAERVKQGFTRQSMSELVSAPREQVKRERDVVGGLPYGKTDKKFVQNLDAL